MSRIVLVNGGLVPRTEEIADYSKIRTRAPFDGMVPPPAPTGLAVAFEADSPENYGLKWTDTCSNCNKRFIERAGRLQSWRRIGTISNPPKNFFFDTDAATDDLNVYRVRNNRQGVTSRIP